jgi:signal transduction histidine kinase
MAPARAAQPPLMLVDDGQETIALGLRPNRLAAVYRFGPAAGVVLLLLLTGAAGFLLGARQSSRVMARARKEAGAATVDAPALLVQRVARALRDPLTVVHLTVRRLQMEYREKAPDAAADLDRYTVRIERGVEELRRLTSTFLKLVDPEARQPATIDLNAFVSEFAERLRTTLPRDVRLNLKLEPALPPTQGDHEQLHSVLENLSANAIDAMPKGGVLTIATGLQRGVRWTENRAPRDYLQLEVLDIGVGIPREVRSRMFDPGFTTREGHTGLGLSIVRRIVEEYQGVVTVESEVGTGSAFAVHLPIADTSAVTEGAARSAAP